MWYNMPAPGQHYQQPVPQTSPPVYQPQTNYLHQSPPPSYVYGSQHQPMARSMQFDPNYQMQAQTLSRQPTFQSQIPQPQYINLLPQMHFHQHQTHLGDEQDSPQKSHKTNSDGQSTPKFSPIFIKCTFMFQCENTQSCALVGSVPELGDWDPLKAQPMQQVSAQLAMICVSLPSECIIEYKYIAFKSSGGIDWENLPTNRLVNTSGKKEVILHERWGEFDVKEDYVPMVPPALQLIEVPQPGHPTSNQSNVRTELQLQSADMKLVKDIDLRPRDQHEEDMIEIPKQIQSDHLEIRELCEENEDQQLGDATEPKRQKYTPMTKMKIALKEAFKDYKQEKNGSSCESQHSETNAIKIPDITSNDTVELDRSEPILHVCQMLPYKLQRNPKRPESFVAIPCYHNPSFLFGSLDHLKTTGKYNFLWLGLLTTEKPLTEKDQDAARQVLLEKKCYPIFLTKEEEAPYLLYYETVIRPKMHSFLELETEGLSTHQHDWQWYTQFNLRIAQEVLKIQKLYPSLRVVWIHGDHLMMAPKYIRNSFVEANIGFFFHSAFPASSVFRTFSYRKDLLHSLLQADLIGFHQYHYASNFLKCCTRLLEVSDLSSSGTMAVGYHGRTVEMRVSHIGIDEEFIHQIMRSQAYVKQVETFKREFKGIEKQARKVQAAVKMVTSSRSSINVLQMRSRTLNNPNQGVNTQRASGQKTPTGLSTSVSSESFSKGDQTDSLHQIGSHTSGGSAALTADKPIVISSIDTFMAISGIKSKLKGYQKFLQKYPAYQHKVVLIQFISSIFCESDKPSSHPHRSDMMTEYMPIHRDLQKEIIELTQEIHHEFGPHCLLLMEGNPNLAKRMAIWSQTQILLVSTLKDGLCLPPLEFVTVKKLMKDFKNSSMVLSEFSGCSDAFSGFHSFNSFVLQDLMLALDAGLSTSAEQKETMMKRAYQYTSQRSFSGWVESFLRDLKQAHNPTQTALSRFIYLGIGSHQGTSQGSKLIAQHLNIGQSSSEFFNSHRCLLLIDHEALPRKTFGKYEMQPTEQTILDLIEITNDNRNTVAIISNQSKQYLQRVFNRLPMIWLASESGYEYKTMPLNSQSSKGQSATQTNWQTLFPLKSRSWLYILKTLMEQYCSCIEGSFVEERSTTIVWNYKNTETEHGLSAARQMYSQIQHLIGQGGAVEIVRGNGFLEVKPVMLSKRQLVEVFLQQLQSSYNKIDYLLYIGADTSDEHVFKYLKRKTSEKASPFFANGCVSQLCILGRRQSIADFYIEDTDGTAVLLNKLAIQTKRRKKNRSHQNLTELVQQEPKAASTVSSPPINSAKLKDSGPLPGLKNIDQKMKSGYEVQQTITEQKSSEEYTISSGEMSSADERSRHKSPFRQRSVVFGRKVKSTSKQLRWRKHRANSQDNEIDKNKQLTIQVERVQFDRDYSSPLTPKPNTTFELNEVKLLNKMHDRKVERQEHIQTIFFRSK